MRGKRTLASMGFIPLLLLGTACGKSGGGGHAATDPNAPIITNLRASLGRPCTLSGMNLPGTVGVLDLDYTDADGNVRGGSAEVTATFPVGGSFTVTGAIPSPGVTVTGTTSGTISLAACIRFGGNARVTYQAKVTDAPGKVSNILTLETPNPGGVPLAPRGSDGAPGMTLEF
jgi:hypothetical protein